ncbi:MAG: acyl-CoA thioesterase [Flavobacteriaceae bacterium]|nr:acyl-CoA thioesterase [Flavobacteriaceae bacterium]
MNVFSEIFTVPASAIDERNHVNNLTYLQWCVDAAEKHWNKFTSDQIEEKYVWFVLNHNINYKNAAFEGEELKLTTWIEKNEGVKSERHYKITRIKDDKTLIEAKTVWCLLNAETLRPTKITEEIKSLFQ